MRSLLVTLALLASFLPSSALTAEEGMMEVSPARVLELREIARELQEGHYGQSVRQKDGYDPITETVSVEGGNGSKPINLYLGEYLPSVVQFIDSLGSPWPIKRVEKFDNPVYKADHLPEVASNSSMVVYPQKTAGFGMLPVFLEGYDTPIFFKIQVHPTKHHNNLVVRVLGVNKESERSKNIMMKGTTNVVQTTAVDQDLNHIIHNVAPSGAEAVAVITEDPTTRAWKKSGDLLVRTTLSIFSPANQGVEHGQNNYTAYRFSNSPTRLIGFDEYGNSIEIKVMVKGDG